ncbi:DUF742 domain-containing protein [Streptomyces sp. NBC_01262]|uniref:DUF742 domain-containing protein n=1 Tax=Streptomyces sp. NBC_01262 TaxID=2903803 RepID=UPI002E35B00A|nr:DUF742 domain-containing protein [Streptomyces sp. NBC_01262]
MSEADQDPESEDNGLDPGRMYVVTGGRTGTGARAALDLVTLIVTKSEPQPTTQPEAAGILRMCESPLSVAEISAYTSLPISLVTVILADLLEDKHVEARAPVPKALLPERALIEAVMHGLQQL